jgi:hypothetical protein
MGSRPRPPGCGTANSGRREPRPGPGGRRSSRAIHPEPGTAGPGGMLPQGPGPAARTSGRGTGPRIRMGLRLRRGTPGERAGDDPGGGPPGRSTPGWPGLGTRPCAPGPNRARGPGRRGRIPGIAGECAVTPRSGPGRVGRAGRSEVCLGQAILAGQRPVSPDARPPASAGVTGQRPRTRGTAHRAACRTALKHEADRLGRPRAGPLATGPTRRVSRQ